VPTTEAVTAAAISRVVGGGSVVVVVAWGGFLERSRDGEAGDGEGEAGPL